MAALTFRELVDRAAARGLCLHRRPRTRDEVAEACGISTKHLQELIAGRAFASDWTARRIAAALHVSPATIRELLVRRPPC